MPDTTMGLVKRAHSARRENRPADALRDFERALELGRESGVRRELIAALKGLAQVERDLGYLDAARPLYEEAVVLCREQDDPLLLAHTVRHLGDVHREARRFRSAEACYEEALAIYRGHEDAGRLDLANAIRSFALLEEEAGDRGRARRLWEEARALYEAVELPEGVQESEAHLFRLAEPPGSRGRDAGA